jgi:serine/threonine protein kinase
MIVFGQIETNRITAPPKVYVDSFNPIGILGEGKFGKVILVKKKASNEYDQRFAMKALKKSHIINCCSVTYTVTEEEALVLASGHPFITTLYSCFQTKVISNFLNLLHISRESLIVKFTISMEM